MTLEVEETTGNTGNEAISSPQTEAAPTETSSEEGESPAYNPNFKYKVHGQEKEFEDWVRSSIKDAETEKKARDLFTRADGIEHVKQDRERMVQENEQIRRERADFDQSLSELGHYVKSDDLTTFFSKLQIPKEQVLRWALKEVQMADNPALRQQEEARRQADLALFNNQRMGQHTMTQYEQAAVNLRTRELDFTLNQPDTRTVAESFDSRVGRPGAFRDEVIQRGQFHWHTQGIDVPVEKLIQEVTQVFGLRQAQGQVQPNGTNGVVQGSKGKPVIPAIPGSGQSAVKKQIKGLAGLKARRDELIARE